MNLFPVFDVPVKAGEKTERRYMPAPLWDIEKGDFVTSGAGRALYGTGYDAWVLWCTKTIMTERMAHLAYGDGTGIEAERAFGEPGPAAVESAFVRTITEALLADPMGRTRQVREFKFERRGDGLGISCAVFGRDGNSAAISVTLKAGR